MPTATQHEQLLDERIIGAEVGTKSRVGERRASTRRARRLSAQVTRSGSIEPCSCVADDLSEGGVYVRVPASQGICVGHRCEIVLTDEDGSNSFAGFASASCFGTVVRTEIIRSDSEKLIGAGVRFDQPLFL